MRPVLAPIVTSLKSFGDCIGSIVTSVRALSSPTASSWPSSMVDISLVMGVGAGGAVVARDVVQRPAAPETSRLRRLGGPASRLPAVRLAVGARAGAGARALEEDAEPGEEPPPEDAKLLVKEDDDAGKLIAPERSKR